MRLVGPILYFRGRAGAHWHLAALLVQAGGAPPPPLEPEGAAPVEPRLLAVRQRHAFWRYDFAFELRPAERLAAYTIGGRAWPVGLPCRAGPLRLAYTACSGTEDDGRRRSGPARNALWRQLASQHEGRPFHLLLQGGDQLYADTIWQKVPELAAWRRLPWREGNVRPFTPAMAEEAAGYYFGRYRALWAEGEIASLQARVPSIMMWDDHDIFDGWGSWPEDRQASAVFQGLFGIARDQFALFQLGSVPFEPPLGLAGGPPGGSDGHLGCAYRVGDVAILAPDLRSQRTRQRVMGEAAWHWFEQALARAEGCRHLLLMSSVPLVNADLSWIERVYVTIPGHSDLEDDLRDQWQSLPHRAEWRRMLELLLRFKARTGAALTALSGEIHLGALGLVEGAGESFHELTASGIVHPPPHAALVFGLEHIVPSGITLAPDLRASRIPIPDHGRKYLRARNWLSLELFGQGDFAARWQTEHGPAGRLTVPQPARSPAAVAEPSASENLMA